MSASTPVAEAAANAGSRAATSPDAVVRLTEDDPGYQGWSVVAASAAGVYVSFASLFVYTFGILLKPLAETFGWSREGVSAGFGVAAMMIAVCSPLLGQLFDRFGPRRVILPCLTVFGLAFASLSLLTPRLWHLYVVFAVLGMVGNGTAQMAYSRAVSTWFDRHRGLALALMMCGGALGAMTLPPLAQWLIGAFGWRSTVVGLGLGALAIGLPVVALFVRERPVLERDQAKKAEGATVLQGLASRGFWILSAVLFFASIAQNGAIAHLSALLTDRGVSAASAAAAVSVMGGASVLGRLITGWLIDRYFAAWVSFGLLAMAAAGTFLLAGADSFVVGALGAALIGFGMGGEADVIPYMLSRYFGLRSFATLYGLTWTVYAIAGAIGPIIMGKAFDATGSYEVLLTQLSVVMFGVATLMLFAPRYSRA
jgi:predicted MFS family arabinose efflux permease